MFRRLPRFFCALALLLLASASAAATLPISTFANPSPSSVRQGIFPPVPNDPDELDKAEPYRLPERDLSAPLRGYPGDLWADVVLGKERFSDISPFSTVGDKLFWAYGTIVDRTSSPEKLYIYDSGNSRILGLDLDECLSHTGSPLNCDADIVIGQPDMSHAGCNGDSGFQNYPNRAPASASTLCGQLESQLSTTEGGSGASMAVDADGNLYVTDFFNSRVLKYISPFTTDQVADDVWGQVDFSGNVCNQGQPAPNSSRLCFTWGESNNWVAGVDVDAAGNLWVVDNGNNRVLRFPPGAHTADIVIGQANFTTRTRGNGLNQLSDPSVVRVNSKGWLYVADQANNRVMLYEPPFGIGMSGRKFGPDMPPDPDPEPFYRPNGIEFDPAQPGIWIMNQGHKTFERWDEDTETLLETIGRRDDGNLLCNSSGSTGIDSQGNKFFTVCSGGGDYRGDVLLFEPGAPGTSATRLLFGPVWVGNQITAKGLASGGGVIFDDNRLTVADNGRLIWWDDPASGVSGQDADGVAGGVNSFDGKREGCCYNLKKSSDYIWTVDFYHRDYIEVYNNPLTQGADPLQTLTYPFNVLGGGQINGSGPFWGILPTADSHFLWVSHRDTNRVFRVRDPLTNPVVDVILGQIGPDETLCNREPGYPNPSHATPNTLCMPGPMSFDNYGNLYLSDHSLESNGNNRLLMFDADLFPTDNTEVLYAPAATKIFTHTSAWEPAFDSHNRMVVGYNPYLPNPGGGWFPGVYEDPLGPSTVPDALLNDYFSMAISATFDDQDNLYVGDGNRGRVLLYYNPISNPPRCGDELFTDVCPGDYYYTPTLELNAAGIVSGYDTVPPCEGISHIPCFKAFNNLTRGQAAKLVTLAAGFDEEVSGQTFEDVLPGSTFYTFTERLASRGYINGYPCGGDGEPCGANNLPYFRTGNNVTRGQLAKIATLAFEFSEPVSGQTFEDVAIGSTFYEYVERIADREIISGYPCGVVGEPCVPPDNRPYFRPNNAITRGQTSKIVYLSMVYEPATPTPGVTPTSTPLPTIDPTATATSEPTRSVTNTVGPTATMTGTATVVLTPTSTATPQVR